MECVALHSDEVWKEWNQHEAWLYPGVKVVASTVNISPTKGESLLPRLQRGDHRKDTSAMPLTTLCHPQNWGPKEAGSQSQLRSKWSKHPSKNLWKGSASFCYLVSIYHCCLSLKKSYHLRSLDTATWSLFPQTEERNSHSLASSSKEHWPQGDLSR